MIGIGLGIYSSASTNLKFHVLTFYKASDEIFSDIEIQILNNTQRQSFQGPLLTHAIIAADWNLNTQ